MSRRTILIVSASICALLGYHFYVPFPADIEERWKSNIIMIPIQLLHDTVNFVEFFRISDEVSIWTNLFDLTKYLASLGSLPKPDGIEIVNTIFDGVKVRLYTPKVIDKKAHRGFIYMHGGGWASASPDLTHEWTMALADRMNMVVVSVDYRLAPANVYPIPFEDCVRASKHFLKNADKFGVDPKRIAIGGDSAGGNLAAAVALKLRDIDFKPALKIQVPIFPALQAFDFDTLSYQNYGHTIPMLKRDMMLRFWLQYKKGHIQHFPYLANNSHSQDMIESKYAKRVSQDLLPNQYRRKERIYSVKSDFINEKVIGELKSFITDQYFSPLAADNLEGLPKTYMITAEYDVLRDDGILYVENLRKAGNDVTHRSYKTFHGFTTMLGPPFYLKPAIQCFDDLCKYLKQNL